MIIDELRVPIVLAPMAGGPSTPELAAAVSGAGGFGQLAAGYLSAADAAARIAATRALTDAPFGVNLFVPGPATPPERFAAYLTELGARYELGTPAHDTDDWDAKLDLLTADPVAVVTCTFGCPSADEIARLHAAGSEVWVTVTSVAEAELAVAAGADVLVAQGAEAGGHRATFVDRAEDDRTDPLGLLALVQLLTAAVDRPIVAAGGIATGAGVAAALAAGAAAAQVGTAFLRCPEAGTNPVHRAAVPTATPTALTRAFTGRRARGIRNRFLDEHTATAPVAYPEIHYATGPLRARARAEGNPEEVNLWAGQAHALAVEQPAGELVAQLAADAKTALETAFSRRFRGY
ncbi:nitronate monooxygenase [Nocardia puris]|uniref:Propionate 3-nitronate monooxygenase n=3 Tax=Nocardia puris TaxID=208602 RepID=A0A366CZB5_9NOCA|nr:nitronate monooxygenase [Nocardia puris]MBF6211628.1 nitronate monooxygenase [Nocardia puris]MBF6365631.1 nitronate monooxygenase [Nocardia puris]MBF6460726.1 nitronate monooxygenase [Nocardia puris]RBO83046.1 nitroalkane oxidase [Nocardia puris]